MINKSLLYILVGSFLFLANFSQASYELVVINTNQNAKNLIPILQPLFAKQASFSAQGYRLIVKAAPQTIKEIKSLLKEVDIPLQNLIISFSNREQVNKNLKRTAAEGHLDISKNHSISTQNPNTDGNIQYTYREDGSRVKIISTNKQSKYNANSNYQARVLEGNWVFINTGQQVPYQSYDQYAYKKNKKEPYYGRYSTQFVNVYSGFDAKAYLSSGERVVIHIKPHQQNLNQQHPKRIDVKSLETQVSGKLGEWIPIGQALNSLGNNVKGITYQTKKTNKDNFQFYIQVKKVKE